MLLGVKPRQAPDGDGLLPRRDAPARALSVSVDHMSTERRADPFGVVALAAAGTMSAHELGYLADRNSNDGAHAYFNVLGPLVLLALCVAGWTAAVRIVRRDAGRAPLLVTLAGLQVGGYLAMEIGERLFTDSAPALLSTPVLLGLLLQPALAWLALRILHTGHRVVEALFVSAPPLLPPGPITLPTPVADIASTLLLLRLRVRGPPVR